jgi:hypothetical protein
MDAEVAAALIASAVSLLVAVATTIIGYYVQRDKLRHELRTEFMAEQVIARLLNHPKWRRRSFTALRKYVGGFDDDELRRLLVRSGALRFQAKDNGDDEEFWGLLSRNKDFFED